VLARRLVVNGALLVGRRRWLLVPINVVSQCSIRLMTLAIDNSLRPFRISRDKLIALVLCWAIVDPLT